MNSPLISIIVPVYNTENYLHRCIDSILAQTFTDFELLLIDDGSTDSSGAICDKYAAQDSRVRVFHKPNGGASSARNLGLDNALGEWISFVDSDDWIDIAMYEEMIHKNEEIESDVIVCSVKVEKNEYSFYEKCPVEYATNYSLLKLSMIEGPIYSSLWNKLIRLNFIKRHKLYFDSRLNMWDDLWVILRLRFFNPRIAIITTACYHYVIRPNSITKDSMLNKVESELHCALLFEDFFKEQKVEQQYALLMNFLKFRAKDGLLEIGNYNEWLRINTDTHKYVKSFNSFYGFNRCLVNYLLVYGKSFGIIILKFYQYIKKLWRK